MSTEPTARPARPTARPSASAGPSTSTAPKVVPGNATLPARGKTELRAEAVRARAELASTLDALEYKLNLPKRAHRAQARMAQRLRKLGEDNPAALLGLAAAAAAVAGAVVWIGARSVLKR